MYENLRKRERLSEESLELKKVIRERELKNVYMNMYKIEYRKKMS